jgi:regulation of enolase protein 1 (concanavalin A-like superfamily)
MSRSRVLLLAFVAGLLVLAVRADEKPGTRLKGWGEVIDPDRDCQIDLDKGKVTMKVPGKAHDFAAELQRWNAPRILSEAGGDFILEVKVSGEFKPSETSTIEGRRPYNGAGLLIIKDDKTYISLHRAAVYLENNVRHYLNFELRKDAELAVSRYEVDLDNEDTYLRLERRGDKVYALGSHDHVHWKLYDDPIEIDFPRVVQVGVEAVSSSDQPFRCAFEDYAIFRKANAEAAKP